MKLYKIIFILIPLLYCTNASACWDDDNDDWYDWDDDWDDWDDDDYDWWSYWEDEDDWDDDDNWDDDDWDDLYGDIDEDNYDIDGGSYIDDFTVTYDPDDDDSDDDWWRTDREYEEEIDSDECYNDDDDGSNRQQKTDTNIIAGSNGNYKEYEIRTGDKIISFNISREWVKQTSKMNCVVTAMEYVSQILNNSDANFRIIFTDDYKNEINTTNNMNENGVFYSEIDKFINIEFNTTLMYNQSAFITALDYGCPILSIIGSEPLTPWSPIEHMIVIIGQTEDRSYYIYIDPTDGKYKTISYYAISGPNYRINSSK